MDRPLHPGLKLRDEIFPTLGISIAAAAEQLGIDRTMLSRILNGRSDITMAMARRLEIWIGKQTGDTMEDWVRRQTEYDLWAELQKPAPEVKAYRPITPTPQPKQGALFLRAAA